MEDCMRLTHYLYFTLSMNLLACGEEPDNNLKDGTVDGEITVDADGDGYLEDEDCDDNNPAIYPSAEEVCDGFDNDCDAQADEDVQSIFYADSDNDGFGNENRPKSHKHLLKLSANPTPTTKKLQTLATTIVILRSV